MIFNMFSLYQTEVPKQTKCPYKAEYANLTTLGIILEHNINTCNNTEKYSIIPCENDPRFIDEKLCTTCYQAAKSSHKLNIYNS